MLDLRIQFGRMVAAHPKANGWTQAELSVKADISLDMVSKMERGVSGARFPTIARLASVFDIQPADLFAAHLDTGPLASPRMNQLLSKIATLSDRDIAWLDGVIDAALKRR